MEVDDIVTRVEGIVQDTTYDSVWIIDKFNECLLLIAGLCRIPGLQFNQPVTAALGGLSVAMPKTFVHDLYMATSVTYPQGLLIAPNLPSLIKSVHPESTGPVQIVALEGKTLHFRPVPEEAETLSLFYYGTPKELSSGDSFPDYIPAILQKEIFLGYACKEAYSEIEDGTDGKAPNTAKYSSMAAAGLNSLVEFYPSAPKARPELRRGGSFF